MFKEQMNKIKSMIIKNDNENLEGKKDKKKIENLVFFLIILIVTLIAINVILKSDNPQNENEDSEYKQLAQDNVSPDISQTSSNLEEKIEHILSTMSGVRKSKCINNLLTVARSSSNV